MKIDLDIKNCFEYICPEEWDNLEKSDNESIRFCGSCEKQVFKATDKESFDKLVKGNKCVAYFPDEKNNPTYMGETVFPMFTKAIKFD